MNNSEKKLFFRQVEYNIRKFFIKIILAFIPVRKWRISTRDFLFGLSFAQLVDPFATKHFMRDEMLASGEKWKNLKGKFKGKRCFLIGSAPSVKSLNLSLLKDEYTFTCNKGFLLKDCALTHSSFYCLADKSFYDEFKESIDLSFADYYFVSNKIPWTLDVENLYVFETGGAFMGNGYFQRDLQKPLAQGGTVVSKMLQMAYYLGFEEIYMIGVDLDYQKGSSYFYNPSSKEKTRTPDARGRENQLMSIEFAAEFLRNHGIKIFNASPSGVVDCMPRVKYDELVLSSSER